LENRPDDLDDFSVPQVDFDVVIDGESFADGESQATGSSGNSCIAKLLTKLRELLQLNLRSQPVLAEVEEFTLSQGRWPNPHHSRTSMVHQACIIWLTHQLQPSMKHLKTYSTTITLTGRYAKSNCIPC
jgi:hypothetical protein